MESRFEELKKVILERAHEAGACREQYGRAYRADSLDSLMQVVRDNFWWATFNKVIDGDLIDDYKDEFNAGKIWHNESASEGFVLASGSASVEASGSASVKAYGSASVKASGSASVEAYDSASVEAYDSASVKAYDSAYVCSWSVKECQLSGYAIYRIIESNTIRYVDPTIRFERVEM